MKTQTEIVEGRGLYSELLQY